MGKQPSTFFHFRSDPNTQVRLYVIIIIIIIIVDFIRDRDKLKNKVWVRRYAATSEKAT